MKPFIQVTRVRSASGCDDHQLKVLAGLGLHRKQRVRVLPNTPSVRGAMRKVIHLLAWEEIERAAVPAGAPPVNYEILPPDKPARKPAAAKAAAAPRAAAPKKRAAAKKTRGTKAGAKKERK